METVQVRLKPHAPRQGCVMRTYRNSDIGAFEAGVWHTVSREQADYLKTIRQQYCDETTPFAFEIYEEAPVQKEIVTESFKCVDARGLGKVKSENSEPVTSGVVREEAPVQKEIVTANSALGNHDEQAVIHGSRAENTSLDVPLPGQAKLNVENSEPVTSGVLHEESSAQKEIVTESLNSELGNHDEQVAIQWSRAKNTSVDMPLPWQALLNAENSEPVNAHVVCSRLSILGDEKHRSAHQNRTTRVRFGASKDGFRFSKKSSRSLRNCKNSKAAYSIGPKLSRWSTFAERKIPSSEIIAQAQAPPRKVKKHSAGFDVHDGGMKSRRLMNGTA